jgi:methionyl-tRNA synthetase
MWQAMLMAAGIKNTDKILINGFLNGADGKKMSKSLGNVINPYDAVNQKSASDAVQVLSNLQRKLFRRLSDLNGNDEREL